MSSSSLRQLFFTLSFISYSVQAQNVILYSSDEKLIDIPATVVASSGKLCELLKVHNTSSAIINISSQSALIERFITFSETKSSLSGNFRTTYAELMTFLSVFGNIELPHIFFTWSFLDEETAHEFAQKILSAFRHTLFPTMTSEAITQAIILELSEQINLAVVLGNEELTCRLSYALAGAVSYLKRSPSSYLLPLIRELNLPEEAKIRIIQSISNLFVGAPAIKCFLKLILDAKGNSSSIKRELKSFDEATVHHLLYILETYFEPHDIQRLRGQEPLSTKMNRERLKEIAQLEDVRIKKARTLLISILAKSLIPKATNRAFVNVVALSSLPTSTIAEIIHQAIERYPGILLEFADIDSINIRREMEQRPLLQVLTNIPQSKPFKKILSAIQQQYPYSSFERLYHALKIDVETLYNLD